MDQSLPVPADRLDDSQGTPQQKETLNAGPAGPRAKQGEPDGRIPAVPNQRVVSFLPPPTFHWNPYWVCYPFVHPCYYFQQPMVNPPAWPLVTPFFPLVSPWTNTSVISSVTNIIAINSNVGNDNSTNVQANRGGTPFFQTHQQLALIFSPLCRLSVSRPEEVIINISPYIHVRITLIVKDLDLASPRHWDVR